MRTTVVINPYSSKLRKGRGLATLRAALAEALGEHELLETTAPGGATELARRAIEDGAQRVVAVGGDGTLNEVANGFMGPDGPLNRDAVFAFVMTGSGNDFQRTFGRPAKAPWDDLSFLSAPQTMSLDLGRVSFRDRFGERVTRHFLNIASFGISGEVDRRVNDMRWKGLLGGKATFLLATVAATLRWRNKRMHIRLDGQDVVDGGARLGIVANGCYAGGGMRFAPEADPCDGLLNLVTFEDVSTLDCLVHMRAIYEGEHIGMRGVRHFRGRRIEATAEEGVELDVDGENPGTLPATFEVLPGVLRVQY